MPAPRRTPPGSRPPDTCRRLPDKVFHISVIAALVMMTVIVVLVVPASAETIYDDHYSEFKSTSGSGTADSIGTQGDRNFSGFTVTKITDFMALHYVVLQSDEKSVRQSPLTDGVHEFTYSVGGLPTKQGRVYVERSYDFFGSVTGIKFLLFFDDWDIGQLTGTQTISTNCTFWSGKYSYNEDLPIGSNIRPSGIPSDKYTITHSSSIIWENEIKIEESYDDAVTINITRQFGGKYYPSTLYVRDIASNIIWTSADSDDSSTLLPIRYNFSTEIVSAAGKSYIHNVSPLGGDLPPDPSTSIVTVYIQNSQTGALLSDAHILIEGTPTTSDWVEYVNTTLPSGSGTYNLPGMPHQYRITATANGYTSAGYQYFRAGDTVIVEMEPYIDAPANESNTFLEFYIRDLNANSLGGATVAVEGQWLYSNNNGYARFEVPKNATYPYRVTKSGYMAIEGTATVGSLPRYTVNVVLGPGTVPTYTPTSGPGETPGGPGATPTPDSRSSAEKAASGLDFLLDNAENFGIMAAMILLVYMGYWMVPKK